MQYPIRRSKRALSEEKARAILEKGEYGVLSLQGEEGEPYGIPLSYVVLDNFIYFHCALEGRKIDYMKANPLVSFCVVGRVQPKHRPLYFTTLYESAIVTGGENTGPHRPLCKILPGACPPSGGRSPAERPSVHGLDGNIPHLHRGDQRQVQHPTGGSTVTSRMDRRIELGT